MAPNRPALVLDAVVPAAGRSSRAGVLKPAVIVRGRPLLAHAAGALQPWCRRIVVVTGWQAAEVAALAAGLPGVDVVENRAFAEGMFSSVRAGIAALGDGAAGFFVLPADCPFVEPEVFTTLAAAFARAGGGRAVVPTCAGRGGHPLLLPDAARAAAAAAPADATLRDLAAGFAPLRLPVDSASVLVDLDTPADLDGVR